MNFSIKRDILRVVDLIFSKIIYSNKILKFCTCYVVIQKKLTAIAAVHEICKNNQNLLSEKILYLLTITGNNPTKICVIKEIQTE
ncbi:hypothetical protein BpHYR1_002941 [Brachionus plicatilis]|uniref:Uncharacterized protein n=1 Tax=Brachionus plicatilis TaxID=10195 RepID=A0A3M7T4D1_BRAPC|nr:hypothetical protein BpHYR1_002941 [Brachionus plicatilis]